MAFSTFKHVKISGLSVVVPDTLIPIEDEIALFDNDPKILARNKKILGLGTRYVIPINCNATATDLCEAAAKKLISDMKININTIDAIIVVIEAPDYFCPNSACILHGRLDLPESTAAFDINHGCASYTYGLWTAGSLIESGACKSILMLTGDKASAVVRNAKDAMLFGDAGSATLIEYSESAQPSFFSVHADGKGYTNLISPFGGARIRLDKDLLDTTISDDNGREYSLVRHYMDGMGVFKFTMSKVPESIKALLEYASLNIDDIDYFALHQGNKQIIDSVAASANIPTDKYSSATFTKYGNLSNAAVPSVVAHILSDRISDGRMRIMLSGFGIGLAWSNAIIELDNIYCSGIVEKNFDYVPTRDEEINFWKEKISERINNMENKK